MQETRTRILSAIAEGPVTGPTLADELDISRAAVWKHVEALREQGFEVTSGEDGYVLDAVPEFGPAIEFELDAPYTVEYHDSIDSTNRRARDLADDGESDIVVVADEQTGGRGRLDRPWSSPSGGIWLSVLVRPDIPPAHAPLFTLAAAVAVTEAVSELDVDATIKWPNDVLVDGRKLVGILTEMEGEADRVSWIVVGMGINANVDPADLPSDSATSLREACGDIDRRTLTQDILERFARYTQNRDAVLPAWRDRSTTLGQRVRVETGSGTVEGEALDVTFPGALEIETADGVKTVTTGDCEHLRPVE